VGGSEKGGGGGRGGGVCLWPSLVRGSIGRILITHRVRSFVTRALRKESKQKFEKQNGYPTMIRRFGVFALSWQEGSWGAAGKTRERGELPASLQYCANRGQRRGAGKGR